MCWRPGATWQRSRLRRPWWSCPCPSCWAARLPPLCCPAAMKSACNPRPNPRATGPRPSARPGACPHARRWRLPSAPPGPTPCAHPWSMCCGAPAMRAGSHCWPAPWCWPCNCKATQPRVLTPARPAPCRPPPRCAPCLWARRCPCSSSRPPRIPTCATAPTASLPSASSACARPTSWTPPWTSATLATGCMRCCSVFMKTCATSPPMTRTSAAPAWTPLPRPSPASSACKKATFCPLPQAGRNCAMAICTGWPGTNSKAQCSARPRSRPSNRWATWS